MADKLLKASAPMMTSTIQQAASSSDFKESEAEAQSDELMIDELHFEEEQLLEASEPS